MPISKENQARYPDSWHTEIRPAILERANDCCEGSPVYPDCRARNREPHPVTGSDVVLTIAHLDHTPENCDPENLKAWCQRCHLTYDIQHHAATRRAKFLKQSGQRTLPFAEPEYITLPGGARKFFGSMTGPQGEPDAVA